MTIDSTLARLMEQSMNICMCGVEDGYPHRPECPRPLFRGSEKAEREWRQDSYVMRKANAIEVIMAVAQEYRMMLRALLSGPHAAEHGESLARVETAISMFGAEFKHPYLAEVIHLHPDNHLGLVLPDGSRFEVRLRSQRFEICDRDGGTVFERRVEEGG